MLKMNWIMDNDGRLVTNWDGQHQGHVVPSYLTEETADHRANQPRASAKVRPCGRTGQVWNRLKQRVREFAGRRHLPWQIAKEQVASLEFRMQR